MRTHFAVAGIMTISLLAACGQANPPSASAPTALPDVSSLVQATGIQPDANHVLVLIDGATDLAYRIETSPARFGSQALNYVAVPTSDVQLQTTQTQGPAGTLGAQASCLASSEGAYYKNVQQGGVGWDFDAILPFNTTNVGPHVYGGYKTSSVNMEVGMQYNTGNVWELYMRLSQGSLNQYAPDTGGVYTTKGWNMSKYYFANGDTVHDQTRSLIGSDGGHYIVGTFSTSSKSYTIAYKGTASANDFDVSSLRPSNSANIELRKVISLASPVSGSKIVGAKLRNTTYATSSGSSVVWPSNFCGANYGSFTVTYDGAAAAGADTVSIQ